MSEPRASRQATDGHHHLLFDPSFGEPTRHWFDPQFWSATAQVRAADGGRGSAWFIDHDARHFVLRHYRRGGRAAAVSKDRYVFTGLARTRAFREWQLLFALQAHGLPAPAPVAAKVERLGLTYRAQLITLAIPNTRTLADRLAAHELDAPLLKAVGRCVARFHAHGVWHADLNAHNILVDHAGQVFLIDFDRGSKRSGTAWQRGNLERLSRSFNKLVRQAGGEAFDAALWAALESGYHAER